MKTDMLTLKMDEEYSSETSGSELYAENPENLTPYGHLYESLESNLYYTANDDTTSLNFLVEYGPIY